MRRNKPLTPRRPLCQQAIQKKPTPRPDGTDHAVWRAQEFGGSVERCQTSCALDSMTLLGLLPNLNPRNDTSLALLEGSTPFGSYVTNHDQIQDASSRAKEKRDWDQLLSGELLHQWNMLLSELQCSPTLIIPRCLWDGVPKEVRSSSLHGFCDASKHGTQPSYFTW